MVLQQQIDQERSQIKTDQYSISFGELISLYEKEEIDIHPEFQRYFRWSNYQKTRLIESILLGIPLPSIFVAQRVDGILDVVDGLQRLSTIFQFVGILRDQDKNLISPLVLEKTNLLPALEGKVWSGENEANNLTIPQQLLIKRSKIGLNIILNESDEKGQFELFQRLNTGGSPLTDQEVRNSMLVLANKEMYAWIRNLSNDINFKECIPLTDTQMEEQYDMELVLRFLIFRTMLSSEITTNQIGDLSNFLDTHMNLMAHDGNYKYEEEEKAFHRTFQILAQIIGEDAFKKYFKEKNKFSGPFLVTGFEIVALGIGYNFHLWNDEQLAEILPKIQSVWTNPEIIKYSGRGIRANTRLPHTVPVGRKSIYTMNKDKVKTPSGIIKYIEEELVWRRKELNSIKYFIERKGNSPEQADSLLRGGMAVLYAHWEGFVKDTATAYVCYVAQKNLKFNQLSRGLFALAYHQHFNRIQSTESFTIYTSYKEAIFPLFDSVTALQIWNTRCNIKWEKAIDTESNLNSDILKKIFEIIGLEYLPFYKLRKTLIDEKLLKHRNSLVHGEKHILITKEDFLETYQLMLGGNNREGDEIEGLIPRFADQVLEAIATEAYERK